MIKTPETYHNLLSPVNRRQLTTKFEPQPKVMLTLEHNWHNQRSIKTCPGRSRLKQRGISRRIRQFNIHFNIQVPI